MPLDNLWLSLLTSGLLADLPDAPSDTTRPYVYLATDTNSEFVWNPATAAWELRIQRKPVTVANLPAANLISGTQAFVTDATAPAIGATVAGAGAVFCGVVWNGANWKVV